jgi:hypothetical protein
MYIIPAIGGSTKNSSPYSIINIVENGTVRNGLVSKKQNVGACKKGEVATNGAYI